MKKILISLVLTLVLTCATFASTESGSFTVPAGALWGTKTHSIRAGAALPFTEDKTVDLFGNPSNVRLNGLIMTDMGYSKDLYLGVAMSIPLYAKKDFEFGFLGGWSANFNDITHAKKCEWGVGAYLTLRF